MWKPICTEKGIFLLDNEEEGDVLKFRLTDLKKIWMHNYDKETIFKIFQDCNPILEIEMDKAVSQVISTMNEDSKAVFDFVLNDKTAKINVETEVNKLKIKFGFDLFLAEGEEVAELLVAPLIQTVNFLEKQQEMLVNLLHRKDKEIEQYRMEHETISRSDLITEKFDESLLKNSNRKLMVKTFGQSKNFVKKLGEKYGEVKEEVAEIPLEPWNKIKRKRKIYSSNSVDKKNKKFI